MFFPTLYDRATKPTLVGSFRIFCQHGKGLMAGDRGDFLEAAAQFCKLVSRRITQAMIGQAEVTQTCLVDCCPKMSPEV